MPRRNPTPPPPNTLARQLLHRAESYRHYIPEWPALAESLEREARQLMAAAAAKRAA